jgi:hypothetical protein
MLQFGGLFETFYTDDSYQKVTANLVDVLFIQLISNRMAGACSSSVCISTLCSSELLGFKPSACQNSELHVHNFYCRVECFTEICLLNSPNCLSCIRS